MNNQTTGKVLANFRRTVRETLLIWILNDADGNQLCMGSNGDKLVNWFMT